MGCARYGGRMAVLVVKRGRKVWTLLTTLLVVSYIYNKIITVEGQSFVQRAEVSWEASNSDSPLPVMAVPSVDSASTQTHHSLAEAAIFHQADDNIAESSANHRAKGNAEGFISRIANIQQTLPYEDSKDRQFMQTKNGQVWKATPSSVGLELRHTRPLQLQLKPGEAVESRTATSLLTNYLRKSDGKDELMQRSFRKDSHPVLDGHQADSVDTVVFNIRKHEVPENQPAQPANTPIISVPPRLRLSENSVRSVLKGKDHETSSDTVTSIPSQTDTNFLTMSRRSVSSEKDIRSEQNSEFNITAWETVQAQRKRLLRQKCEFTVPRRYAYDAQSIVDIDNRLLYCPVEKSASTFLRRFMYAVSRQETPFQPLMSPFDVPIRLALRLPNDDLRQLFRDGVDFMAVNSTRFIVVREPFSRLFSAYVDKLIVPNSYYWKRWGITIIERFRKSPSEKSRRCGHDVTFGEFVKFVLQSLHKTDNHVKPVTMLCVPCAVRYNVIGHAETLQYDFQYLLQRLNIQITNFSADTLKADFISDAIIDSTFSAFENVNNSCMSLYETCQRLWLKMKLRGIISNDQELPLNPEQTRTLSAIQFVQIIGEARRRSGDAEKLREQKHEARRRAFTQLSRHEYLQLLDLYASDFEMFGYDPTRISGVGTVIDGW